MEDFIRPNPELNFHEKIQFIHAAYDAIESFGFAETFRSSHREYMRYNGMKFTVAGRVSPIEVCATELDMLPMWHITMENGDKLKATPEEVTVLYQKEDEPEPLEDKDDSMVTDVKTCDHLILMRTISFKMDDIQLFADIVLDTEKEEYSVWFYEDEGGTKYFMYGVPVHQHLTTGDHNITFNEFYEDVMKNLGENACCFLGAFLGE